MNLTVQPVAANLVHQVWGEVELFIKSALDKSCGDNLDYTADHVRMYVAQGQWTLLVAVDENNKIHGATTINFINFPLSRVAFITAIGGKLISNADTFAQLQHILKLNGVTKIQGFASEAVARLWKKYNFESRTTLVEALL